MRVGSLFAGIGGFDLGLERAGAEVVWQVEKDPRAQSILARHWPGVPLHDDVAHVRPTELAPVDCITAGFPCTDLSVALARRRPGLAGERSGLFRHFIRLTGALAPRWVLLENVTGLLHSNGGRDMGAVLGGLGELGYGFEWRVLDAQYFGLAQRRRRVFIVGHRGGLGARPVLLERGSMPWNLAPSREAGPGVAAGAGGSPRAASGERVAGTVTSKWAKGGGPAGDEHYNLVFDTAQITSPDNRSHVRPGQPCPTIPANGHTPAIAGTHVRKLTPRECERLQGFPDDWTAVGHVPGRGEVKVSDTARYRALGNAVAVPVVEWIGRRMLACDDPAA